MKRIVHIVPVKDEANGVWRLANMLASEDGGHVQTGCAEIKDFDEVWVHGMWLPREWRACWWALRMGKRLVRMTHGSLSPVYLTHQGKWKKWLVGPIERLLLRRADVVVATCKAEAEWIRAYEPRVKKIEVVDIKRFFDLEPRNAPNENHDEVEDGRVERVEHVEGGALKLLYLGRRHPLKGLEFLETAVKELGGEGRDGNFELTIVSNAFGEEKEKVWDWCDVLVLPTLSENFGLVVAEALERGKRVITTDGAPAWGGDSLELRVSSLESGGEIWTGYGGRLMYLVGYRDGTDERRVELLKSAIETMAQTVD
jgi:glycosyltransferase involved in cell wall biosynthesis